MKDTVPDIDVSIDLKHVGIWKKEEEKSLKNVDTRKQAL